MIPLSFHPNLVSAAATASHDIPLVLTSPATALPRTALPGTRPSAACLHYDAAATPSIPTSLSSPASPSQECRCTLSRGMRVQGPLNEADLSDEEGNKLRASASPAQLAYFGALSNIFEEHAEVYAAGLPREDGAQGMFLD